MKGNYSEFALRQLQKYGWSEGSGLGADGRGRSEPVKAARKRDTTGLGFDAAAAEASGWWEDAFSAALDRTRVDPGQQPRKRKEKKEKKEKRKEEAEEAPKPSALYRRFAHGATLLGTNSLRDERPDPPGEGRKGKKRRAEEAEAQVEPEKEAEEEEEKEAEKEEAAAEAEEEAEEQEAAARKKRRKEKRKRKKAEAAAMDDAALLRLCGGRTAHPAARHGLRLGGKLARVARMDAELLRRLSPRPAPAPAPAT